MLNHENWSCYPRYLCMHLHMFIYRKVMDICMYIYPYSNIFIYICRSVKVMKVSHQCMRTRTHSSVPRIKAIHHHQCLQPPPSTYPPFPLRIAQKSQLFSIRNPKLTVPRFNKPFKVRGDGTKRARPARPGQQACLMSLNSDPFFIVKVLVLWPLLVMKRLNMTMTLRLRGMYIYIYVRILL
jgi:hypothetical protein